MLLDTALKFLTSVCFVFYFNASPPHSSTLRIGSILQAIEGLSDLLSSFTGEDLRSPTSIDSSREKGTHSGKVVSWNIRCACRCKSHRPGSRKGHLEKDIKKQEALAQKAQSKNKSDEAKYRKVLDYSHRLALSGLAQGLDIKGSIQWNDVCPGLSQLGATRVALDNGLKYSGGVRKDGSFVIPDVPSGTYILRVDAHDHQFDNLRIDVPSEGDVQIRPYTLGNALNPPPDLLMPYPIRLHAKERLAYFTPPQSFNLLGMLSSPMVLMTVFGGGMVLAMPYIMKNMDPEQLEDFKAQQAQVSRVQNALSGGDLRSGFSALIGNEGEVENSPPAKSRPSTKAGGKKGRR